MNAKSGRLPFDVDNESRRLEDAERSISEYISQPQISIRRSLHSLNLDIRDEKSSLQLLEKREEELTEVIEGRLVPSAVDLPSHEADDIRTKLRLRIKGVKGLAIERAKEDIVGVRERIDESRQRLQSLEDRRKKLEEDLSVLEGYREKMSALVKEAHGLLREISSSKDFADSMVGVFGWFNPYFLSSKALMELSLSRAKLSWAQQSREKRMDEILRVEAEIEDAKDEIKSILGEAYEDAFLPIVFKNGRSPLGKRYLNNELTYRDVQSIDIESKIRSSKSLDRKADRLSSMLWDRRVFLERALEGLAHLCELRMYKLRILKRTEELVETASRIVSLKLELCQRILDLPERIAEMDLLSTKFYSLMEELDNLSPAIEDAARRIRSDL